MTICKLCDGFETIRVFVSWDVVNREFVTWRTGYEVPCPCVGRAR